ncbi:MAG: DEAD/DEAH box helicase [Micrococcales bacterium]|nr:DEAD/DEAH box helicase [Micrococcales bacterium]
MSAQALVRVLLGGPTRQECARHIERIEARDGLTVPWPAWLEPSLADGLGKMGVDQPWQHQVEAAQALHDGNHVVLATPAGSGKSLAMWLDALDAILRQARAADAKRISAFARRPTALYLAPTKALAADQLVALNKVLRSCDAETDVRARVCDGDSSTDERAEAQAHGDIILTNPDFLHFSLLPQHERWARFFRTLRTVIVDEAHAHRGVFGAHVSLVIRRLRRIAAHHGAEPTFAAASATIAEPGRLAATLFGVGEQEITPIEESTAPSGRRTIILWQPPELAEDDDDQQGAGPEDPWAIAAGPGGSADGAGGGEDTAEDGGKGSPAEQDDDLLAIPTIRKPAGAEAAELLADLAGAGARTLGFVRSRFAAESVADGVRHRLPPSQGGRVAAYRGGYLAIERRDLEKRLRSGSLTTVVTTSALELGIDISGLDTVVSVGWPGTRASLWQQFGRAGRAGAEGLAVWIAGTNPLDTFLVNHPEAIFGAPMETSVFNPSNPHVLAPHLCAAAAELPLTDDDVPRFGPDASPVLEQLGDLGVLRRRSTGWHWIPVEPATSLTDLRGSGGPSVQIVNESTGDLVGTVDGGRADATVHPGAVYSHQGATFIVRDLDLEARIALVRALRPNYRTRANSITRVSILSEEQSVVEADGAWAFGEVEVVEQVTSYTRLAVPGLSRIDTIPLDLPERVLRTASAWLTLTAATLEKAEIDRSDLPGALHAWEHAAIGLLPLLATCDRWDLGGLSTALHAETSAPTVFIHDAFPGGAGFAEQAFRRRDQLIATVAELLATCPCAEGCPGCIQSPKCGNANQTLDKAAASRLATVLATSLALPARSAPPASE